MSRHDLHQIVCVINRRHNRTVTTILNEMFASNVKSNLAYNAGMEIDLSVFVCEHVGILSLHLVCVVAITAMFTSLKIYIRYIEKIHLL